MGVKKTVAEHGDRVVWRTDQGDFHGTIIDTHAKTQGKEKVVPPNYGVLADDADQLRSWPKVECVVLDDRPLTCPRCGVPGHRAQTCQTKYLTWKQERSNQAAQQPTPQPVVATPAPGWAVDF